ncbi:hypothetical protein ABPG75_005348 [Micractinium tetrahymenae]
MPSASPQAAPRMLLLLAVAAAAAAPPVAAAGSGLRVPHWQPQWPWPQPADPKEQIDAQWARTLEALWASTHDKLGFCIGSSQRRAQRLVALSFPWPLPVSNDTADGICSNHTRIDLHLCGPPEIELYYKYMLLTENPEKVPDNQHCSAGGAGQPACSPGFFDERLENRPAALVPQQAHACCEGFFCPPELTCMMPCPLGSYCPRARPAPPPERYRHGDAQWCAPYAYKGRQDLGCGGADKWRIIPGSAFPLDGWEQGSGSIYCDGGHFCPNTTSMLGCPPGQFCRQGSTEPSRCPPGVACPAATEIPDQNYTGVTVDALLFGVLWLAWLTSRQYNRVLQRLSRRERIRITWGLGGEPRITVVKAAGAPRGEAGAGGASRPHSRSHSRSLSLGGPHLRTRSRSLSLPAAAGEAAAAVAAAELGGGCGGSGGIEGGGGGRTKSGGLLGFAQRRRAGGSPGSKAKAGQVWAAWSGPGAEAESGYEPLLDDAPSPRLPQAQPTARRLGSGSGDGGADGMHNGDSFELAVPRRPLSAAGMHARHVSITNEDEMTPRQLHSVLVARHRQSLGSPLSSMHAGLESRRQTLHIEFRQLGLRLKSCGKAVLAGVTGVLAESKVTAIMGPSGAGKTSLLNALAGKAASYGVQTGVVLVNGRPDRLERYKRVMGFVLQDDIMHSKLTVEENLLFSARFRLPAHYTREQHLFHVERALHVLQLEDVRDELVGDEETRGISGGQKKRVNVGLELVADPSLLFLDEPTSGLDSSSSKALVAALQEVARGGVTAAAVIHQPSWQTCLLFDDLLLLGKGGRTVFYGRVADMQSYFEDLGFEFPLQQNPIDSVMDIVSGAVMRTGQASATELFDLWDQHCGRAAQGLPPVASCSDLPDTSGAAADDGPGSAGSTPPAPAALLTPPHLRSSEDLRSLEGGGAAGCERSALLGDVEEERRSWRRRLRDAAIFAGAYVTGQAGDAWRAVRQNLPLLVRGSPSGRRKQRAAGGARRLDAACLRATPGFLPQFGWSLGRAVLRRSREPLAVFTDYAIIALTGMTLGLISDRGRETIMHFAVSITYSVVALGLMSTVGALGTFGSDRVIFFREASSGLNRLAHFLALETFDHTGTLMRSTVYFVMYYSWASPRAVIWQMLLVSTAITYCCTGVAYVLSQIMEPSAAQLTAAVLALINTLIARQGHARGLIRLAQTFSFARWGLEGYVISESNKLTGVWLLARCADLQGLEYDVRRFGLCLLALFGLGLLFRAAALLAMFSLHRDKQR